MYDTGKTELENKIIIAQSLHIKFALKASYIIDKLKLEMKTPDISALLKRPTIMQKLLKQKIKYLISVV